MPIVALILISESSHIAVLHQSSAAALPCEHSNPVMQSSEHRAALNRLKPHHINKPHTFKSEPTDFLQQVPSSPFHRDKQEGMIKQALSTQNGILLKAEQDATITPH